MNEKSTGNTILDILKNPSLVLTFDMMMNLIYVGIVIFVAITLSGLVVEGVKKLMK